MAFGGQTIDDAVADGDLRLTGDVAAARQFLDQFERPQLIPADASD